MNNPINTLKNMFKKEDRRFIATDYDLPETLDGEINFSDDLEGDLFADELRETEEANIDFSGEPLWFEKENVKMRSYKDIQNELFEQDMSEFSEVNDKPQIDKVKMKSHFVKAKADKAIRANIRLENKPKRS